MTTVKDIRKWLSLATSNDTHMMVVCDTFDYEDYPIYVKGNIQEKMDEYNRRSMAKIMEVYNLSLDLEKQIEEPIAWHP